MRRKTLTFATEEDLLIDLTFYRVSAFLVAEFKVKIVDPYYNGNLNAAFQGIINKTLQEQDFSFSYCSCSRLRGDLAYG